MVPGSPTQHAGTAPPRRRRGCLRTLLVVGAVLLALVVVGVVVFTIVLRVTGGRTTSGDEVPTRPSSREGAPTVPRSTAPGTEGVEPIPEDRMLVSVARKPPLDPCSRSGPDFDIEVMGIDGSDRRPLDGVNTGEEELWARLSPDRRRLVFYRSPRGRSGEHCRYALQELWIANVDGSGVRRIFSNERKRELAEQQGWPVDDALQGHADWSPDGRHVVMVLGHAPSLGPLPLLNQGETQLFVLDVDSGGLRQVTRRVDGEGRGLSSDPSFTPDGEAIVFVGCPDRTPSCDDMQILSVPADAERAATTDVVFDAPGRNANDVYVAPDGRSISWMEVGITETRLFVSKFQPGREIRPSDAVLVDAHGGYANWTADSEQLVYSRLWLGDRFAIFVNSFDGKKSRRVTPTNSDEVFYTPSP